jgi:hypothetical protein
LQHLYTDDRELFDLIEDNEKAEIKNKDHVSTVHRAVQSAIDGIGNFKNTSSEARNFGRSVMSYIINDFGTERWMDLTCTTKSSQHIVTVGQWSEALAYDDLQKATEMQTRFNNLGKTDAVSGAISLYQINKKLRARCDAAILELISRIETNGNIPHGACSSCIGKYDAKAPKKYKSDFSELEKTQAYMQWNA